MHFPFVPNDAEQYMYTQDTKTMKAFLCNHVVGQSKFQLHNLCRFRIPVHSISAHSSPSPRKLVSRIRSLSLSLSSLYPALPSARLLLRSTYYENQMISMDYFLAGAGAAT